MTDNRVVYVDAKGMEYNALVTATNTFHPGYLSLVYVDANGAVVAKNDVVHIDQAPVESNPDLPTYHLNCWKGEYDYHAAPPADHPMFDHPFAPRPTDEDGRPIPASRPLYDADVADHQEAALYKAQAGNLQIETKNYADGSSATGPAPLPNHSPDGAPAVPDDPSVDQSQAQGATGPAPEEKHEGLLGKIAHDIKKGAEVVGETAVGIATSGLGAFQE